MPSLRWIIPSVRRICSSPPSLNVSANLTANEDSHACLKISFHFEPYVLTQSHRLYSFTAPPRTEAYTRTEYVPSASVPAQKVAMGNANVYANKIEEMRARTQQTTAMSAQRVAELERNRKNRILYQVAPTTPVSSTFEASGI